MGLLAAIALTSIIAFGPVALDFWTELGLIVIGVYVLSAIDD
jgi:hypothetical protein